jgi:RNA polymerase sigma factor (sigma-70 family)
VTQCVFTDLARKARTVSANLSSEASLVGWLYRGTRFAARDMYRDEMRRTHRERQAMEQLHPAPETPPDWEQLRPVLDDAMSELDDTDRDALLLRYFKNHDLRTVGATLGISDDAAQKRVSRAVERLREFFAKRGVTVGAGGLAGVISANAVQAAPVGLALTISTAAALTGTTLAATATATATKAIAMTALQKTLITTTVVLGIATPLAIHYRVQRELREQNASLRQKLELQLDTAAQLETDNGRLTTLIRQATNKSLSDEQFRELLRLRGEVGQLRNRKAELEQLRAETRQFRSAAVSRPAPPGDAAQDYFPKESWAFAGYADPESTFQSLAWAMSKGDLKTMLAGVSPEERARMEKEFEGKSESEILAAVGADVEKIKGFRILKKEMLSESEVMLTVFSDGKDETAKLRFRRIGNEWKMAGR